MSMRHSLGQGPAPAATGRGVALESLELVNGNDNSGLRSFKQPAALVALAVGDLSALERQFCRSAIFSPRLSEQSARRLHGIIARSMRGVGL